MREVLNCKIDKNEVLELAEKITDSYIDYPLYQAIFGDTHKNRDAILYQTWQRLYVSYDCIYTNEDRTACVCVIRPNDKVGVKSIFKLLTSHEFTHGVLKKVTFKRLKLLINYGRMNSKLHKRIYNPKKDYFLKALWIDPKLRGGKVLRKITDDLRDIIGKNCSVFFETDSKRLVMLYRKIGAKVCAETEWHGITHTLMCYEL